MAGDINTFCAGKKIDINDPKVRQYVQNSFNCGNADNVLFMLCAQSYEASPTLAKFNAIVATFFRKSDRGMGEPDLQVNLPAGLLQEVLLPCSDEVLAPSPFGISETGQKVLLDIALASDFAFSHVNTSAATRNKLDGLLKILMGMNIWTDFLKQSPIWDSNFKSSLSEASILALKRYARAQLAAAYGPELIAWGL